MESRQFTRKNPIYPLFEKNVHSLIICDAIFVTVRHERHLPSFFYGHSPKAPFNEAVASSYT